MEAVDAVLAHYGRKGMKWGVRKSSTTGPTDVLVKTVPGKRITTKGGAKQPASDDAIIAVAARQKAKASTIDSLSNQELQTVVTRMNLEQQYSKLSTQLPTKSAGKTFVRSLVVNTAKGEITTLSKGQKGPVIKQLELALTPKTIGKHRK